VSDKKEHLDPAKSDRKALWRSKYKKKSITTADGLE